MRRNIREHNLNAACCRVTQAARVFKSRFVSMDSEPEALGLDSFYPSHGWYGCPIFVKRMDILVVPISGIHFPQPPLCAAVSSKFTISGAIRLCTDTPRREFLQKIYFD